MTTRNNLGQLYTAIASVGTPRLNQGAFVVAAVMQPPNSPPQINQGALVMAVRQIPAYRFVEIGPAVDLPCIATCGSVQHFWRET